jgi:hypothetical protein
VRPRWQQGRVHFLAPSVQLTNYLKPIDANDYAEPRRYDCGPQKLDQTCCSPELRERTPATTGAYQNPCRTFAEVSYALLCTVMHFATDVTAKKERKFKDLVL